MQLKASPKVLMTIVLASAALTLTAVAAEADLAAGMADSAANPYAWAYQPRTIQITTGDTVTWTNNGVAPHSVTSSNGAGFDSGDMQPGQSFQWTFGQAGEYPFYCTLHPWMTGTVTVADAS